MEAKRYYTSQKKLLYCAIIVTILLHVFSAYWYLTYDMGSTGLTWLPTIPLTNTQEIPLFIVQEEKSIDMPQEQPLTAPQSEKDSSTPAITDSIVQSIEHKEQLVNQVIPITQNSTEWDIRTEDEATVLEGSMVDKNSEENSPDPQPTPIEQIPAQHNFIDTSTDTIEHTDSTILDQVQEQPADAISYSDNDSSQTKEFTDNNNNAVLRYSSPRAYKPVKNNKMRSLAAIAQGVAKHYTDNRSYSFTAQQSQQQLIASRLGELKKVSYIQKVYQALQDSSVHSKEISLPRSIYHTAVFSLTLNKAGTLISVDFTPKTPDDKLNEHILTIFKRAQFPRIPPQFEQEIYTLTLPVTIDLPRGTTTVRFHYRSLF